MLQREIKTGLTDGDVRGLSRADLYARIEKAVGWTGMNRFSLPNGNTLFQKNETGNPTETHYDRCYVHLIKNLELDGKIRPGDMLLETTSGSAGVSFAWVCKKLGYEAVVFMPAFVPEPRILLLRLDLRGTLGADFRLGRHGLGRQSLGRHGLATPEAARLLPSVRFFCRSAR